MSPYSITYNLYNYFKAHWPHKLDYKDYTTRDIVQLQPNDIFIGHPDYDTTTITPRTLLENTCGIKLLIFPLHHGEPHHNLPFDNLVNAATAVYNIMGPYWYDTLNTSPFAHWIPKITRLDMAVDTTLYPYTKHAYNPPECRNYLHIGYGDRSWKNADYLYEIIKASPQHVLYWYGHIAGHPIAKLPNVKVHRWANFMDQTTVQYICNTCDFFINTSSSDANPTTLLETTSWGLTPICTPTSGYTEGLESHSIFTNIPLNDTSAALKVLDHYQTIPSDVLLSKARQNRIAVETYYTWDIFCATIWDHLQTLIK